MSTIGPELYAFTVGFFSPKYVFSILTCIIFLQNDSNFDYMFTAHMQIT